MGAACGILKVTGRRETGKSSCTYEILLDSVSCFESYFRVSFKIINLFQFECKYIYVYIYYVGIDNAAERLYSLDALLLSEGGRRLRVDLVCIDILLTIASL